ncbi:bcl-2-related ovarian killer protein-like [Centruroides sculpturatus]|uniref:bcl-2-related ovarian killer protein-like n=1 Tax=Centruroides sculpturatus TaxID=218467 RepID=UPI000C6D3491|nr:bcl-2-related ovarian killer protein-like [Centruroides sculpturatus]
MRNGYILRILNARNRGNRRSTNRNERMNMSLGSLGKEFKTLHRVKIYKMTAKRDIQHAARVTFLEVANEIFSDGITWSKIMSLFSFASEMTVICYRVNITEIINEIQYMSSTILQFH